MPLNYTILKYRQLIMWMFDTGTRVVEVLNSLLLLGFTATFLYNFSDVIMLQSYKGFAVAGSQWWWVIMGTLGVVQIVAAHKKSLQSNQFSGYVLLVSSWVWALISATFIYGLPPLTTAPITYGVFSAMCGMAGMHMIKCNKATEDKYKQVSDTKTACKEETNKGV